MSLWEQLPPTSTELHRIMLKKSQKHFCVALVNCATNAVSHSFVLHQVEAKKLAARLQELAEALEGEDFVEGAYLGGLPTLVL